MKTDANHRPDTIRTDHLLIADWVTQNARVLDVGCGNGELLQLLEERNGTVGQGLEISRDGVTKCLARGLTVIQGDADRDLENYPDNAFDYAILSQTIQAMHAPKTVLEHLLRIAHHAVVSVPNFGYWRIRLQLAINGRMPVTRDLPHEWFDTPNIHLCTIADFRALTELVGAKIDRSAMLDASGRRLGARTSHGLQNLISSAAVFMLTKSDR